MTTTSSARESAADTAGFEGYVVEIGASAGGLEALELLFAEMPPTTNAAFVVVQHLSPDHKSMMATLLARHTAMPVVVVEDGAPLAPNTVFLIPAGSMMVVVEDRLRLSPKNPHGLSLPIDHFFDSLATHHGPRAVAIVLSGTGSDGARGAVAINDAGGLLLAQDPKTCKFDGMPRSTIATGRVDDVLPPEAMGPRVGSHVRRGANEPARARAALSAEGPISGAPGRAIDDILDLLAQVGGVDFRPYKEATLLRRIERRMHVRQAESHEAYRDLLRADASEISTLRRDILIAVTSFFRDPESFKVLAEQAIDPLVRERVSRDPIRVWVAGTSTGEEAYTIAILFAEACERFHSFPHLKIFATDIEQQNLDVAAAGVFTEAISNEISPERLARFFKWQGSHFSIIPEIRQSVIFARHNLLEDPSFTRMDIVTCRNALIYFQAPAQQLVMRKLEYALNAGGALMLGSSEALGDYSGNFAPISSKHRIYRMLRRASPPIQLPGDVSFFRASSRSPGVKPASYLPHQQGETAAVDEATRVLMQAYAPASVLVNARRELVHLYGDLKRFLQFSEGRPTLDIAKLLPEALGSVAMALLFKVGAEGAARHSEPTKVTLPDGSSELVRLVARRCDVGSTDTEPCVLLTFETLSSVEGADATALLETNEGTADRLRSLERELSVTRESLQTAVEELETANEELQASNEELMASNEELQSSNEELQSVNEELYTVNAENQEKIQILNRANADLDTMGQAVSIATVFVDDAMRITRFTTHASAFFRVRSTDVGRELDSFTHNLELPTLMEDVRTTLKTGCTVERETRSTSGRRLFLRILPYQRGTGDERGAVLTLVDVTELQHARRLQALVDALPAHLVQLDAEGKIVLVNDAWRAFALANGHENLDDVGIGADYLAVCGATGDPFAKRANDGLRSILSGEVTRFSMEYPCDSATEKRWFLMYAAPIGEPVGGAIVTHFDITHWMQENPHVIR